MSATDWVMTLGESSWRGVPFDMSRDGLETGRRLVVHEFPGGKKPLPEDLAPAPRQWTIEGYVYTPASASAMVAAGQASGSGLLVTPLGSATCRCLKVGRAHDADELGRIKITLELVEADETPSLTLIAVPSSLEASVATLVAILGSELVAALRLDIAVPAIEDLASVALVAMLDRVSAVMSTYPLPPRLIRDISAAITLARARMENPRRAREAMAAIGDALAAMMDQAAPDQQRVTLKTLTLPHAEPEEMYSASRRKGADYCRVTYAAVEYAAGAVVMRAEALEDWGSRGEALLAKERIRALYDAVTLRGVEVLSDRATAALTAIRDEAVSYLTDRATTLKPLIRIVTDRQAPVATLAHDIYGSPGHAIDIVDRNVLACALLTPAQLDVLAP